MQDLRVTIRKAVQQDVDAIVRLANAGGPEGYRRRDLPSVLPRTYLQAFATIDSNPNYYLMVAEIDRTVVGTFHLIFLTYLAGEGRPD
ncbi:MAG: hypothetical protein KDA86_03710 [Planctomycetaceae bacterium]|nr:hypothetical protein [Planctomycetaceae bacterium]